MKTLGICFGATSIQYVILQTDPEIRSVVQQGRIAHEGNILSALIEYFSKIDRYEIDRVAVTGRSFREKVVLSSISEPRALEIALREEFDGKKYPDIVISSGGETQIVYKLSKSGGIVSVYSGNKCASGTGEFFLQQIRRMGLSIEEASQAALRGTPHKIAGRCSVFCKSDCTHALNKGESIDNIAAGLCYMMADKVAELIKDISCKTIAIIGGGSLNAAFVNILRERYGEVIVPSYAGGFEAYGAALWASENPCVSLPENINDIISVDVHSFGYHPPLSDAVHLVEYKKFENAVPENGDVCVLGLDVGSTTTKAVLVRIRDKKILASVYLRTNGDPVGASKACYSELNARLNGCAVSIIGLGVTGSGRHIAGLHALSGSVINEIIAHATAAAFFDKDVDTIFEIGGQDAKYTYLTAGVPSDYAMNEACSAGTGSFLEESARESLNVAMEEIGELALKGMNPPNFTDQCAAFISSDIKKAGHEGIAREDILAGLVYSICLNYLNRVKGERPVGRKIFMQGGVCYNRAVTVAMASLIKVPIIVPPEPGLMGAFGVALEVIKRINLGIDKTAEFDLRDLASRSAEKEGSFICAGGKEKCDRKCEIKRIRVGEKLYPFGGMCDRYYNLRLKREVDTADLDLVETRRRLMFDTYGPDKIRLTETGQFQKSGSEIITVGLNLSFFTHSLYPLYSNFFTRLGFKTILSDRPDPEGVGRAEAAFCLPAELGHGSFYNLLKKRCDYIFMPQVMQLPVNNVPTYSRACVFVQGEPYYLKTTFRKEIEESGTVILSPVLKMQEDYKDCMKEMVETACRLGASEKAATKAYLYACDKQVAFEKELFRIGRRRLYLLDKNPDLFGIVLFGRPYNAFANEANMGVPHKIASRGYEVIPFDMIPADEFPVDKKMFWAMGQKNMKAAQFVKGRDNLFGVWVTNFSCGPDSFLLGYFREYMGSKPSLTIELDQHTADAGIDTRIDAAVDIMSAYRKAGLAGRQKVKPFQMAKVEYHPKPLVRSSAGEAMPLNDPRVEVLIPSMGRRSSEITAAVLKGLGINAGVLPVAERDTLVPAKKNASCKECLPYLVTSGSFLKYIENRKDSRKVSLFMMATGGGPCRLGQYYRAFENVIRHNRIENAAMLVVTDENAYGGLGSKTLLRTWQGLIVADVFEDIRSVLSVAAKEREAALETLESLWREALAYFEGSTSVRFSTLLSLISARLREIPLKIDPLDVPVISLVGEIFVRRDEFSRNGVVDYLEKRGFVVKVAPLSEYICYSNFVVNNGLGEREFSFSESVKMKLTARIQEWWERRIKTILSESGLFKNEMIEVEKTVAGVGHLINENFRGECILTVGLAMREILNDSCGVVSIGPFGCMYSRMSEAILKKEMDVSGKSRMPGWAHKASFFNDIDKFPFLSIETDGNPFPQLVEANLEAFILQAGRVHEKLMIQRGRRVIKASEMVENMSEKV